MHGLAAGVEGHDSQDTGTWASTYIIDLDTHSSADPSHQCCMRDHHATLADKGPCICLAVFLMLSQDFQVTSLFLESVFSEVLADQF